MNILEKIKKHIIQKKANILILKLFEDRQLIEQGAINHQELKNLLFECDWNIGNKKVGIPVLDLMYRLKNNNMLSSEEMMSVIEKNKINKITNNHKTNYMYILEFNKGFLSNEQLKKIWDRCSKKHQEMIVNYFFQSNLLNAKDEIVDFLLYDCKIKVHKNIIKQLEMEQDTKTIGKIEKRDLWLKLQQNLINNSRSKKNIKI